MNGRWSRSLLTYLGVIAAGALTLVVVLDAGRGAASAPKLSPLTAVAPQAASCFGPRLAAVQSGVYLDLYRPGPDGAELVEGQLGARIGAGRVGRGTGWARVHGTCRGHDGSPGGHFDAVIRITGAGSATGTMVVGDTRSQVSLVAAAPGPATGSAKPMTGSQLAGRLFLAVAAIIATSRFIGLLFTKVRQPRVMGEIVAGIVLGPSLLGGGLPGVSHYLFAAEVTGALSMIAQFGLIFFMFLIGLELDVRLLRGSGHAAVMISHLSIVIPFCLGTIASIVLFPVLGNGHQVGFALFLGVAMAITAFPVLARILKETGIQHTRVGALSVTCAAVDDVTAWCLLAVVVAVVKSNGAADVVRTVGLSLLFVAVMAGVVRPVAARLVVGDGRGGRLSPAVVASIIVGLFMSAWATEAIGIHAIFGAFMFGAVLPRTASVVREITGKVEDLTVLFLLPVFFAAVGLSTRIGLLDSTRLWVLASLIIVTAVVGKWAGAMVGARAAGMGWRDATALGILMNTRGLTEIVVLTVGRDLGIVSPALFAVMVIMALVTTTMATPLLHLVYPRQLVEQEVAAAADRPRPVAEPQPALAQGTA